MKLPYLCRLLTLLTFFDVLVFKPVGIPLESNTLASGEEEILPTTNKPPEVLALKAVYCNELTKCPDTDDQIYWRKLCFKEACPDDKIYHCGVSEDQKIVVEFYYPRYPCIKGYYGSPEVHGENVKVVCKRCPAGRFNPERRWSPGNMDACRTHLHIPAESHTVLLRPGNSTDPAVYFCDAKNGWASAHESLFCQPSYQPCSCIYQGESCPGEELLPDMRCVPRCEGERLPEKNFACVQSTEPVIISTELARKTSIVGSPTSLSTQTTSSPASSPDDEMTSAEPSDSDFNSKLIAGLCGFGGIVIILMAIIFLLKKRDTCCKTTNNIFHIVGDYIDTRNAKKVRINKTAIQESASSLAGNSSIENVDDADRNHYGESEPFVGYNHR